MPDAAMAVQSDRPGDPAESQGSVNAVRTIYFLCVNYNGASFVRTWLESIRAQRLADLDARMVSVVVDSASGRDDYEVLQTLCAETGAIVIRSEENVGYFGGLNLGLAAISPTDRDFVVIGNNDLTFAASFASQLVSGRYEPNVLVVSPDVLTADGVHQNPHVLRRTNWLRRLKFDIYFSHYLVGTVTRWFARRSPTRASRGEDAGHGGEISMGVGACYVLLPAFLQRCGTLYFPWFLFGEEACLAWQVRDAGGVTWYDPRLLVLHAESASSSKLSSRVAYEHGREAYWRYRTLL
jgi:GT2 family glycosyltransferase